MKKVQIIRDTEQNTYKLSPKRGLVEIATPYRFVSIADLKRHVKPMLRGRSKWGVCSYRSTKVKAYCAYTTVSLLQIGCKQFRGADLLAIIAFVRGL